MSLEKVIRPFQIGDIFTARVLAPVSQPATTDSAPISFAWGAENSGDYTSFVLSGLVGGQVVYEEKSRVTKTVRVFNPQDDTQYVDVERIEKLVMAATNGNEIHFNLNNP